MLRLGKQEVLNYFDQIFYVDDSFSYNFVFCTLFSVLGVTFLDGRI